MVYCHVTKMHEEHKASDLPCQVEKSWSFYTGW